MRAFHKSLRHKLADNTDNHTYIFTEPSLGCQMGRAETPERGEAR